MLILRSIVAATLVVALAAFASADDAKKAQKKAGKPVRGTVVSVDKDADKNAGTITVKVQVGTKTDKKFEEKKFKFSETTKVQTIVGKPKDNEFKDGSLADLAKDKMVILTLKDDTVESVKVGDAKKKNK